MIHKNIMAVAVVCLTVIALWFTNRTAAPKDASWEDVVAESKAGNYALISTDELWEKYRENNENILIVDTRQEWEFRTGHIEQAVNFPMEPTWLSRWRNKKPLEAFLGPDRNRTLVFY